MRIRFWGTRGSIATPGPGTVRYGGNTACVEVRSSADTLVVLDCGTGARSLGLELAALPQPSSGHLLIGHTHWDHIQGLPFFSPLFSPGNDWQVYGPRGLGQSLAQTLAGQMQYVYFPVAVDQLAADVTFHDLVEGDVELGEVHVQTQYLNHPAVSLGYRLSVDGAVLVYASDHEPHDPALAQGGDLMSSPADARHVEFLRGADVVIHDTQYLGSEFATKAGWGHSTVEYVVDAARLAGVGTMVLFHHDPSRDDDALDGLLALARRRAVVIGYDGEIVAAAEGQVLDIQPGRGATGPSSTGRSATYVPEGAALTASVFLAAQDPAVRSIIEAAADAEHFPLADWVGQDELDGTVVVVDHDATTDGPDAVRRLLDSSLSAGLSIIRFTRSRPPVDADTSLTDWLVWPASLGHVRTKLRAAVLRRACRWQSAPLPADEPRRVASLGALGILDSQPEERFDRLTRLAARSLDMPMAMISLVDSDRQWFKSSYGVPVRQAPRDQSICAHAILEPELFEVPDLLEDDRFADNPVSPRVRYYAGVPLVLVDGSRVGTLCVADDKPRVLNDAQRAELKALAAEVQDELQQAARRGSVEESWS